MEPNWEKSEVICLRVIFWGRLPTKMVRLSLDASSFLVVVVDEEGGGDGLDFKFEFTLGFDVDVVFDGCVSFSLVTWRSFFVEGLLFVAGGFSSCFFFRFSVLRVDEGRDVVVVFDLNLNLLASSKSGFGASFDFLECLKRPANSDMF